MAESPVNASAEQLALGIHIRDDATFDNFLGERNALTAARLSQWVEQPPAQGIYLCGPSGSGKSHLLQAVCHRAEEKGLAGLWLSLPEMAQQPPQVLEGLAGCDVLCLDGVDAVFGQPGWEEALFHLYNRTLDAGGLLVMSASALPSEMPGLLADLRSRLAACIVLQLVGLRDDDRLTVLRERAERRGLFMPDEVAQYILRRAPRHMGDLLGLLDRLDELSLAHQRRLTVPFVRQVLGEANQNNKES